LINILAHKALMLAYGEGTQQVVARHIRAAARDTGSAKRRNWGWLSAATAFLFVAASCGAGWVSLK
jgi:MSHA biogenesis protein MshM